MIRSKQKLVIKPKSIKVGQTFDTPFPTSEHSVFSDGYDWQRERTRLTAVSDDPTDFAALAVLKEHELLLKQHILRQRIRSGQARSRSPAAIDLEDYDIYPSEDQAFDDIGKLSGSGDTFELQTKHAVRMWEGQNNRMSHRWPGIRYGMALSGELVRAAKQDNPFAHAELLAFERALDEAAAYLEAEAGRMRQQIGQYAASGIHIAVMSNRNPLLIKVESMRGYGFRLLQLLMAYDMLVRLALTMGSKGLTSNTESNRIIYEGGRRLRSLLQGLYTSAMKMRQIQGITRQTLLDDPAMSAKLAAAVAAGALTALPEAVLLYRVLPAYAFIEQAVSDEAVLAQLKETAAGLGLTEATAAPVAEEP